MIDDLLENVLRWSKSTPNGIPHDAVYVGKRNYQVGEFNSHYGHRHTEENKKLIGSKSVNRNWNRPTNYSGAKNPRAKKVLVEVDGVSKTYDCLKDFHDDYKLIPYSTLKTMARKEMSYDKWKNVKVKYDIV